MVDCVLELRAIPSANPPVNSCLSTRNYSPTAATALVFLEGDGRSNVKDLKFYIGIPSWVLTLSLGGLTNTLT